MSLVLDTPRAVSAISAPLSSAAIVSPGTANVSDEIHRLAQLERAVAVALSPLDYADATAWGDALTAALCAVADADGGVVLLPGRPLPWRSIVRNPHSPFGFVPIEVRLRRSVSIGIPRAVRRPSTCSLRSVLSRPHSAPASPRGFRPPPPG